MRYRRGLRDQVRTIQSRRSVRRSSFRTAERLTVPFDPHEVTTLNELERDLRRVEVWPLDSPLAFVIHLAPRTRGRLGEMLLDGLAVSVGRSTAPSGTPDYDRKIDSDAGPVRVESKFSTEEPPRFQQVRDPRLASGGFKYDFLFCISGRPDALVYWVMTAGEVADAMDAGRMVVQHAMSDTKWFFPSRTASDYFSPFRRDYNGVAAWLRALDE